MGTLRRDSPGTPLQARSSVPLPSRSNDFQPEPHNAPGCRAPRLCAFCARRASLSEHSSRRVGFLGCVVAWDFGCNGDFQQLCIGRSDELVSRSSRTYSPTTSGTTRRKFPPIIFWSPSANTLAPTTQRSGSASWRHPLAPWAQLRCRRNHSRSQRDRSPLPSQCGRCTLQHHLPLRCPLAHEQCCRVPAPSPPQRCPVVRSRFGSIWFC